MKTFFLALLVVFAFATKSYSQTITNVQVVFKTTDDDKDFDTKVEIVYKTGNEVLVAYRYNDLGGRFPDNSINNIPLDLRNSNIPESFIPGSKIIITIFPVGNDTWIFYFDLKITLSDGDVRLYTFNGVTLTEDDQTFTGTLR